MGYPLFVLGVAAYVWSSSQSLSGVVATHFDASGHANGVMPRTAYTAFMAGLIVLLPLLIVYLPNALIEG